MKDLITDTALAVMANPATAELEALRSDLDARSSLRMLTCALKENGAQVLDAEGGWVRFRPRPSDRAGIVLDATIEAGPDGEVWITFERDALARDEGPAQTHPLAA
ncbi:hypothetical protein [Pontibaca methylaminivorans]|uniref:Uncharacterized protein n=1 Tax=Pontibaca methylaminivorans TaxID=515897 RepID=A0A1R3WNS8_9RHOB|nr:hypothetical protein [Pontibaca methylaminivorans]SIT79452.1 hypothetical protein SAMN05421849_1141 [Pontibaca methylaminivorans]